MSVGVSLRFLFNGGIIQKSEVPLILVNKTYKFRIYPNKQQEILIAKTIRAVALYLIIFLLFGSSYRCNLLSYSFITL
ncbi:hypothetical protein IC3_04633 [Bacillus cereus VD142]|nr:hypothetical protein IC3_04633 [Bacillus cereus VD142]